MAKMTFTQNEHGEYVCKAPVNSGLPIRMYNQSYQQ